MNRKMLKYAASAMALIIASGIVIFAGANAKAAGDIEINETNFPDKNFREFVLDRLDYEHDGKLTESEISNTTQIWWQTTDPRVSDLTGIEYFTELKDLFVENHNLTKLDVSKLTKLENLRCDGNRLTSLNVSGCTKLKDLYCDDNKLTSLDVSGLTSLYSIHTENNQFTKVNAKGCTALERFENNEGTLGEIDLSGCTSLKYVIINKVGMTKLNLNGCKSLEVLDFKENKVSKLDISGCTALTEIRGSDNELKSIDVTALTNLNSLKINGNLLESIDVSKNSKLEYLDCNNNQIKNGALILNKNIQDLCCSGNLMTKLELSGYKSLVSLDCCEGVLKSINLSGCDALKALDLYENNLTSIELSGVPALEQLWIDDNPIKTVDLSDVKKLGILRCDGTQIEKIDLSVCPELTQFRCNNGKLKSLDISKNAALYEIECNNNQISSFKSSDKNKHLNSLKLSKNALTSFDISKLSGIEYLDCSKNKLKDLDVSCCAPMLEVYTKGDRSVNGDVVSYHIDTNTYDDDGGFADDGYIYNLIVDSSTNIIKDTFKINKAEASVVCGKTLTLSATMAGKKVNATWKSSDKSIATINSSGKITAKKAGKITVTASASGASATCTVQVLFKDVTNSKDFWYNPTYYLVNANIVKGYDKQTKFKPANDCTRAQMVTFLYRLHGEPKLDYYDYSNHSFPDVKKTDYFYEPVIWAAREKITTGYSDGTFKPQNVCTRAQTVTFLWRMAGTPSIGSAKNPFKDVKKSDYFYKPVIWASKKKIVAGYSDGTFKPQGKCLRRQMVTFLYKYDKFVNGKG